MVKAKDFMEYLCDTLEYRFFSGVVCPALRPLYDYMSPERMHYIPANSEETALNLANGVTFSGFKSCVLIRGSKLFNIINDLIDINIEHKLSVLLIIQDDFSGNMKKVFLDYMGDKVTPINLVKNYERIKDLNEGIGIVFVREGTFE
jgi:sulfopyruvate decarboxylase TPP-binding subunit